MISQISLFKDSSDSRNSFTASLKSAEPAKSELCKIFHEKRCRTNRRQRNITGLRGAAAKKYLDRRNDPFLGGKSGKPDLDPSKAADFLCVFPSSNGRNL